MQKPNPGTTIAERAAYRQGRMEVICAALTGLIVGLLIAGALICLT